MKTSTLILAACLIPATAHGGAPASSKSLIKRGQYLITITGCADCHTPLKMGPKGPEPDMDLWLSGHPSAMKMPPAADLGQGPWMWAGAATMTAFSGPWGVSFSANLTSDKDTGLGAWSEKTFIAALRSGKHTGKGRDLLPPMPWQGIGQATEADLRAIFAYLQSTKPIKNAVPDPIEPARR